MLHSRASIWCALFAFVALSACGGTSGGGPTGDAGGDVSMDKPLACAAPLRACGARCADLSSDSANCGACGSACMAGLVCTMGTCQLRCAEGQTLCAGRCVSLQTDGANCGACGSTCGAGLVCGMGRCDVTCGTTLATCGGDGDGGSDAGGTRFCADTRVDPRNCGACGSICELPNASVSACAAGACLVGHCNAGFFDCDGMAPNGCETRVGGDDTSNCGGCGVVCRYANAAATCAMGVCAMGTCRAGYADCDMNPANGCEININTDNANCGRCATACASGQVCSVGTCGATCGTGTTNCSGDCVNVTTDPANCGACATACHLTNVSINACASGACVVGGCNAGFADCDSVAANGCEVNLRAADVGNCGGCGIVCRFANAAASCAMGTCAMGACNMGYADCDMNPANGCETNVNTDNASCGRCAAACASGQVCSAGACGATCGAGTTNCSGDCVNTTTDAANCGACGVSCRLANASVSACASRRCVVGGCNAGFADCDGVASNGCETAVRASDVNNCGGCGVVCRFANAGAVCTAGVCGLGTCSGGFANCDGIDTNGCEVNTSSDIANCNRCGGACAAGQVCSGGACTASCGAGTTNCSGACVNTNSDPSHCGSCPSVCNLANVSVNACVSGACVVGGCSTGFANCDGVASNGCETAVRASDVNNCGGCGVVCRFANAGATCSSGACVMGTCTTGFADCDGSTSNGCEVNITTDNINCGRCGGACTAGQVCSSGVCTTSCGAGTTNCSGACVSTAADPLHCGSCSGVCALDNVSLNACVSSACVVVGCNTGFADCDGVASNGCEAAVRGTDANNCGGCGIVCRFVNAGATCSAGSCVLGACATGYANCDGVASNGCEVNLNSDNTNCRICGATCASGQVCSAGTCTTSCGPGTTNCSGACVNTSTDPSHCGSCTTICALTNVSVNACVSGTCGIGACSAGFGNCDGIASNGCETNVSTSTSNCGVCGRVCTSGLPCSSGTCLCPTGQAFCGGICLDTQSDRNNCGGCSVVCPAGQTCASGACTIPTRTGTVFRVPGLGVNSCRLVEHFGATGGDRGGIALSSTQVFYTGDSGTGRFSAADLSGGVSTGAAYDAIFSDLATQQVYAFGNAAGPFHGVFTGTTTFFDRIFPINGATGVVSGAATMLSASIVIVDASGSSIGYFSGSGRVLLANGTRLYDIALPSGAVVDIGAFTAPSHAICESQGFWGVAEFSGSALSIAYVRNSTQIARTQVFPPGATTTIATFTSLSDMCSFTVSTGSNRWYWHHEGVSQFGGSDESIGYCTMVPGYAFSTGTVPFVDACAAAGHTTQLAGADDAIGTAVSIGFTFPFYGTSYTQVRASTNGYLLFGAVAGTNDSNYVPTMPLPDAARPFPAIFVYSADLQARSTGVCLATVGSAPSRRFVYEGADETYCCSPTSNFTFEGILNESDSTMDFVYQTISRVSTSTNSNQVGLQNSGSVGTNYEFVMSGPLTRVVSGTSLHLSLTP